MTQEATPGGDIITTTPTGRRYTSREPRSPGWRPPRSTVDLMFRELLLAAA